jgi:hypothetical protein
MSKVRLAAALTASAVALLACGGHRDAFPAGWCGYVSCGFEVTSEDTSAWPLVTSQAHCVPEERSTAATVAEVAEAQQHLQRGEEHDGEESLVEFERGHALDPQPEFLFRLAKTYVALNRHACARTLLDAYLERAKKRSISLPAARLAEVQRMIEDSRLHLATLAFVTNKKLDRVEVDGSRVVFQGRQFRMAVDPGRRSVAASSSTRHALRAFELAMQDSITVRFDCNR